MRSHRGKRARQRLRQALFPAPVQAVRLHCRKVRSEARVEEPPHRRGGVRGVRAVAPLEGAPEGVGGQRGELGGLRIRVL